MSRVVVADVAEPTAWAASDASGAPSTALVLTFDPTGWSGDPAMAVALSTDALDHRVERTLAAPADLDGFDDLELWVRADRVADGSLAHPYYMELGLGSAALAIGAAANTWHRLVVVVEAGVWLPVTISLDDLPASVRRAVTELRLTCVDAGHEVTLQLGAVAARKSELLLDVDAALVRRLAGGLVLDGTPVDAVVDPATPLEVPYFRIRNYAVRPAEERSSSVGAHSDYTRQGFSIRPATVAVDIFYAIEPVAGDRAHAAAMFQHAFAQFAPRTALDVAGRRVSVDWVEGPPLEFDDISDQPALHIRVGTTQRPVAPAAPVKPAVNVEVEVHGRAIA